MIEKRLYDCMGGMQVRVMVGWAGRWMQVDVCHGWMGRHVDVCHGGMGR